VPGVGALEADGDVGDRGDAVEVDQDRDQPLARLAVAQRPPEQAGFAVLARREQPHVVAADAVAQKLLSLGVAVDHVLGRQRVRVDERVDIGDHRCLTDYD
jgi:hypothetical protein